MILLFFFFVNVDYRYGLLCFVSGKKSVNKKYFGGGGEIWIYFEGIKKLNVFKFNKCLLKEEIYVINVRKKFLRWFRVSEEGYE